MKELSTEIIEIGGKEYTLFLNRKGIVAFEKTANLFNTAKELEKKYKNFDETLEIEVDPNVNPLEVYGSEEDLYDDEEKLRQTFIKFYWIALYENHKFNLDKVKDLFAQAEKEYGFEQLVELANQMIEDVNTDKGSAELKNLKALRPKKK